MCNFYPNSKTKSPKRSLLFRKKEIDDHSAEKYTILFLDYENPSFISFFILINALPGSITTQTREIIRGKNKVVRNKKTNKLHNLDSKLIQQQMKSYTVKNQNMAKVSSLASRHWNISFVLYQKKCSQLFSNCGEKYFFS